MSGDRIAAKVRRGIEKAGRKTGNGTPLTGTIPRRGPADTSTTPPKPGSVVDYTCTLLLSSFSARDRQGSNISMSDLKAMISTPVANPNDAADTIEPKNTDTLRVGGETYSIIEVEAVKPGGVVLYWKAQVRKGGS